MPNLPEIVGDISVRVKQSHPDCNCQSLGSVAPCANGGVCCRKRDSVPVEASNPSLPAEDDDHDLFPEGDDPIFSDI